MINFDFDNFSLKKFKELSPYKKKMIIGVSAVVVLFLLVFIQIMGSLSFIFSGGAEIVALEGDIKKLQGRLQIAQAEFAKNKDLQNQAMRKRSNYWLVEKDGNVNAVIQNKIQTMANECSVELRSTGTIQMNSVAEGINLAQFDIACAGDVKSISNFIYKLSTTNPKLFWDRTSLRSDDIKNYNKLFFSASLSFIAVENKQLQSLFETGIEDKVIK